MPIVSAPAKVLVTGASGFLAVHVVKALIEKGYSVRGTVRSDKKGEYLKNLFGDKFEYVLVEDMEAPNAYDHAVEGIDAVEHTASITKFETGDPDLLIKPAVNGTIGILESVRKFGPQVKRVVITSSTNAVEGPDETYWNDASVEAVKKDGINAHPGMKYCASKTLAERAAWKFMEDNKGKLNFDLTTLCPPWIWGPLLHEGNDTSSIHLSVNYLLGGLDPKNEKSGAELVAHDTNGFVDARDVAAIHADVLSAEGAANDRFLAVSRMWNWQDLYDAVNESPAFENMPKGEAAAERTAPAEKPRSQKLLKALGRTQDQVFRPLSATIRDTVTDVKANRRWAA